MIEVISTRLSKGKVTPNFNGELHGLKYPLSRTLICTTYTTLGSKPAISKNTAPGQLKIFSNDQLNWTSPQVHGRQSRSVPEFLSHPPWNDGPRRSRIHPSLPTSNTRVVPPCIDPYPCSIGVAFYNHSSEAGHRQLEALVDEEADSPS